MKLPIFLLGLVILIDLPRVKFFFGRKILSLRNLLYYLFPFFLSHIKPKVVFNYSLFKKNPLSRLDIVALAKVKKKHTGASLCCVWHVYKPSDVKNFLAFVREFSDIDHFATFNIESCGKKFFQYLADFRSMSQLSLYPVTNSGRDYRMTTQILYDIPRGNYRYLSKLHFKERDQVSQKSISEKKSIYLVRRHIHSMQIINSRNDDSMVFYGLREWVFDQDRHLGKNGLWIKKLCKRARISYQELLNSQFVSGGMFVVSAPQNFLVLSRLIKDQEFEKERSKKLDGLLCHAMERFFSFFAISKGYKISYLPSYPSYLLSTFFYLRKQNDSQTSASLKKI